MTKIERLPAVPPPEDDGADPASLAERLRRVEGDILTASGVTKTLSFVWEQMETCRPATRLEGLDAAMFLSRELYHYAERIEAEMRDLWTVRDRFAAERRSSEGVGEDA
jgi:hypothetical protein